MSKHHYIELLSKHPKGQRFFEFRSDKLIIPYWLHTFGAFPDARLVSLCIDDQEQLMASFSMKELMQREVKDIKLATMSPGSMLDMTFTHDVERVWVYYHPHQETSVSGGRP